MWIYSSGYFSHRFYLHVGRAIETLSQCYLPREPPYRRHLIFYQWKACRNDNHKHIVPMLLRAGSPLPRFEAMDAAR